MHNCVKGNLLGNSFLPTLTKASGRIRVFGCDTPFPPFLKCSLSTSLRIVFGESSLLVGKAVNSMKAFCLIYQSLPRVD